MKERRALSVAVSWDFTIDCSYSNVYQEKKLQLWHLEFDFIAQTQCIISVRYEAQNIIHRLFPV